MTERTSRSHRIGLELAGLLFLIMIPFVRVDLKNLKFLEGHPLFITLWVAFSLLWMLVTCAVFYALIRFTAWFFRWLFTGKSAHSSR